MSMLELCLIRHAQSVSNASGVWQGYGDSPLSDTGRTQVQALHRALRQEHYDLVLSSDLSRAADTAIATGAEVEHDRAWREIDVGNWEGLTMDEVLSRFPEEIEALKARRPFPIGGGESFTFEFPGVLDLTVTREMGTSNLFALAASIFDGRHEVTVP